MAEKLKRKKHTGSPESHASTKKTERMCVESTECVFTVFLVVDLDGLLHVTVAGLLDSLKQLHRIFLYTLDNSNRHKEEYNYYN